MTTTTGQPPADQQAPATDDGTAAPADDQTPPPDTQPDDQGDDRSKAGREAARYRTQLRETTAQRDALAAQLEKLQKSQATTLATGLHVPADLFDVGKVPLADLLDDSGGVDPDKVAAAVAQLLDARPGLAAGVTVASRPRRDPSQGSHGDTGRGGFTWGGVLGGTDE